MTFIETPRFPDNISYGSSGGPRYNTTVTVVKSGYEYSNINWEQGRHEYDVSLGVRDNSELSDLVKFFHIVRGKGHYFRFKDWQDYKSCDIEATITSTDQIFGIGDGVTTEFQLIKTYDLGGGVINQRDITKPINGTVLIANNSVLQTEVTDYSIDYTTGIITYITAPLDTVSLTWGGEFDVPCRFDVDQLQLSLDFYGYGSSGVPVVEVRV